MNNTPWIHPKDIDYTDAHNPLKFRAWNQVNNRYMWDTLNSPVWLALRNAQNIEARVIVTPVPINQNIEPLATLDQNVSIDPVTWLYAINAQAESRPGFYLQITDALTGATVFSQLIHAVDLSNVYPTTGAVTVPGSLKENPKATSPTNIQGARSYLSEPRLFAAPSYPIVRIVNLAPAVQKCTVNMFCIVEIEQGKTAI